MTKKHYIELANDLRLDYKHRPSDIDAGTLYADGFSDGFHAAVDSVMDALKRDNSNFDRQRFVEAVFGDR